MGLYLSELAFWNSIPVENDPCGLVAGWLVELDQQFPHHRGQVLDDLLPGPLDSYGGTVPAGVGVHTTYHLTKRVWSRGAIVKGEWILCGRESETLFIEVSVFPPLFALLTHWMFFCMQIGTFQPWSRVSASTKPFCHLPSPVPSLYLCFTCHFPVAQTKFFLCLYEFLQKCDH